MTKHYNSAAAIETISLCYKVFSAKMKVVILLYCEREETDDRLQYHISHAVKVDSIEATLVCLGDIDVHTSLLYNFEHHWKIHRLHELWFQNSGQISLVHESVKKLKRPLVRILPAIHALTESDTTSKVGTKDKAFKVACNSNY